LLQMAELDTGKAVDAVKVCYSVVANLWLSSPCTHITMRFLYERFTKIYLPIIFIFCFAIGIGGHIYGCVRFIFSADQRWWYSIEC
jgi:hypothetical protein